MSEDYHEKELDETGRSMIANGLGSAFVVKWLSKRVEDADERVRLMSMINESTVNTQQDRDEAKMVADREERKVKYLHQDFKGGQKQLGLVGIITIIIGIIFFISVFTFGAASISHAIFAAVLGGALIFASRKIQWEITSKLYLGIFSYLFLVVLAFLILGYPDPIIPGFLETENYKIIHIATIVNDFTPMLFYFLLLVFCFPFIKMLYYLNKLKKTNKGIRSKLGILVE